MRPPGAPHRLGGTSRVIAGSASVLTDPTVTADQVRDLVGRLAERVHATPPTGRPDAAASGGGGGRAAVPARARSGHCRRPAGTALETPYRPVTCRRCCGGCCAVRPPPAGASPTSRRSPTPPASSTPAPSAPEPPAARAPPRVPASPAAVLRRQWTRAVHTVAELAADPHHGWERSRRFDARAETVAELVRAVQARADATPGRWGNSRAGLAQRRVLDALCLYHLQAVRPDEVEADIRRLALTCGLDRETARRALLALAADGWIARTHPSAGRRGAHWTIDPAGAVHTRISRDAVTSGPAPRRHRRRPAHHARTTNSPTGSRSQRPRRLRRHAADWASRPAASTPACNAPSDTLGGRPADGLDDGEDHPGPRTVGVPRPPRRTTTVVGSRPTPSHLDQLAVEVGTAGRHQQRADRYAAERASLGVVAGRARLDASPTAHLLGDPTTGWPAGRGRRGLLAATPSTLRWPR